MQLTRLIPILVTAILAAPTAYGDAQDMTRLKTGILPTGGFYSVFSVTCQDGSTTYVASLKRGSQWCKADGRTLRCFRRAADAAPAACSLVTLANNEVPESTRDPLDR